MAATAKVIRTEAEYDAALARVSVLMDALSGPAGQSEDLEHPGRVELDLLVLMIEAYEDQQHPIERPVPVASAPPNAES